MLVLAININIIKTLFIIIILCCVSMSTSAVHSVSMMYCKYYSNCEKTQKEQFT